MDFGKLPYSTLDSVDFSLRQEPVENSAVLPGKKAADPKIYIGCPRWSVKEWIGKLYPKGAKDSQLLDEYVKQFNTIELNSTFYNLYDETAIAKWAGKAGERDFKFCPKVFQGISHEASLNGKEALTHAFEKSIGAFGKHLGPAFLQLNDGFGPQRWHELLSYLQTIPKALLFFVELRHPNWFQAQNLERLAALLRHTGKGFVITDTAGRRDVCHMHLTLNKALVRFVSNNLHPTDYARIDAWVLRIAGWLGKGLQELYFIIHMANEKHSPELAGYLVDRLNEACGLQLKKPVLSQQELF